jgi:hypothetical protein
MYQGNFGFILKIKTINFKVILDFFMVVIFEFYYSQVFFTVVSSWFYRQ